MLAGTALPEHVHNVNNNNEEDKKFNKSHKQRRVQRIVALFPQFGSTYTKLYTKQFNTLQWKSSEHRAQPGNTHQ